MGITPSRKSKDSKSVSHIGRTIKNSLKTGMRGCDGDSLRIVATSVAVVDTENNGDLRDDTWDSGSSVATDAHCGLGSWPVRKWSWMIPSPSRGLIPSRRFRPFLQRRCQNRIGGFVLTGNPRSNLKEYAKFTKENLLCVVKLAENNDSIHALTQTVNSLLGLIVWPYEEQEMSYSGSSGLPAGCVEGIDAWKGLLNDDKSTRREFLRRLRNATAHKDIHFVSPQGSSLNGYVVFRDNKSGWCAKIKGHELYQLCLDLADELEKGGHESQHIPL